MNLVKTGGELHHPKESAGASRVSPLIVKATYLMKHSSSFRWWKASFTSKLIIHIPGLSIGRKCAMVSYVVCHPMQWALRWQRSMQRR